MIAVRTWRPYLLGRRFTIKTDQRSLRYLLKQRILTPEQQKWMGKLVGYDYEITYNPGTANTAADALSRRSNSPCLNAIYAQHSDLWNDIRRLVAQDPYLLKLGRAADDKTGGPYVRRDGMIFFNNRLVLPPDSPIIQRLLSEFHDTPMGGHSGVLRTLKRLSQQFYWPSMHKTVIDYVSTREVGESVSKRVAPASPNTEPIMGGCVHGLCLWLTLI